jgi:hypothetical protein
MAESKPSTDYVESVADERVVPSPDELKRSGDADPNDPQVSRSHLTEMFREPQLT